MTLQTEILVIGAGMAGASIAAELSATTPVTLIEAEAQPGFHSTGRSAAFWAETYGGPHIQPLTAASYGFLAAPPPEFSSERLLGPRGAVTIARKDKSALLDRMEAEFAGNEVELERIGRDRLGRIIPGLRDIWSEGLFEPSCRDIDVAALHAGYLRLFRRNGGTLISSARATAVERRARGWRVETLQGAVDARKIVNAAGAWADDIARLAGIPAVGIQPFRRTIAQLRVSPLAPRDLPLVIDAEGQFYFKPEPGGRIWLSPHDETPFPASDCTVDPYDVAVAVDRLEQVVDWQVERVEHSWAGLRSFAPDRLPVYGHAPADDRFFWFAGQGGFGIQTAPAAARLAAASLLGSDPDPLVARLDPAPYSPGRFEN